ncbi:MAG: DNA internalization-related competence protein ComEC/Rec2 [Gammaproteobacteria bacterium]|nr:DNA internalization-related competence protein ComEC/Rec2 [Gammaproteobacteria bacterium]
MLVRVCLLLLAGGIAAQHSRVLLSSDHRAVLLVAVAACFCCRRLRGAGLVLLGYWLLMGAGADVIDARLQPRYAGDSLLTTVSICSAAKTVAGSSTFCVSPLSDKRLPTRSSVSWYMPAVTPGVGEVWQLELRLRRPRGLRNPGTFDRETWLFRKKIHATGYVVTGKRNQRLAVATLSLTDTFRRDFVEQAYRASDSAAAVLSAVGVGERASISREQWDRYAETGTSHLMAISGLHIGLAAAFAAVAGIVFSGWLRLPGNPRTYGVAAGCLFALVYALLSGFGVPAQRAVLMLWSALVLLLWRRRTNAVAILAAAAIVVFVGNPLALLAPGFSLSFAAVLVLIKIAAEFQGRAQGRLVRRLLALRALVKMQWALLFGLLPFTVLWFDRIAFAAPVVNLIVVPVFSAITAPLALLGMLTLPASNDLSLQLLKAAALSVDAIEDVIAWFAAFDFLSAEIVEPRGVMWCVLCLPVLWVVLPRGWPGRWIAIIAVAHIVSYRPIPVPTGCFDTDVLDVGQGLAVVVRSQSKILLFDTGVRYRNGGSVAEQVLLPFLGSQSQERIDVLVVSHADDDHAGGVAPLLKSLPVGHVYSGEPLRPDVNNLSRCKAGMSWRLDGVDVHILHPSRPGLSGNNASCVLQVVVGDYRMLLTGDIESAAERQLLKFADIQSDIVIIPHHGSATSSTPAFVEATRPRVAIASAGFANRWNFPKTSVVRRWQSIGARVYTTAESGALSFRVCEKSGVSAIVEQRLARQRFWHDGLMP